MTRGLGGHSPANITHHLKGIDFPANKQDLVQQAQDNGADDDVVGMIENMPDEDYASMADVMKAYGEADSGEDETERGSSRSSGKGSSKSSSRH